MTNPDPVSVVDLLRRVEAATGPHWSLDEDIYVVLKQHPTQGPYPRIPAYTASIDAALALVERMLPGAEWSRDMDQVNPDDTEQVDIAWRADEQSDWIIESGRARSTPLAILAALLKALTK